MADETQDNGNRATVAQTLAEVRGLRDLFKAEIGNLKDRFDTVAALPVIVARLEAQNSDQEKRIKVLEDDKSSGAEWRRTHLPTILATIGLLAVAIVTLVTQLH